MKTPCQDPLDMPLWLSDYADERSEAAAKCLECHRITECGVFAIANGETFGVWGGADLTDARTRRKFQPKTVSAANPTEEHLRACHAAYKRGNRSPMVVAGQREYNRRRQAEARKKRAAWATS